MGIERIAVIGHLGDSRAYIFRLGKLTQITLDDSLASAAPGSLHEKIKLSQRLDQVATKDDYESLNDQEKFFFRSRHIITKMLGDERCEPTIQTTTLGVGDKIILTSDGVHDNLTKDEIEKVLNGRQSNLAEKLVQRAKTRSEKKHIRRAKPDDISAIVVEVG